MIVCAFVCVFVCVCVRERVCVSVCVCQCVSVDGGRGDSFAKPLGLFAEILSYFPEI